MFSQTLSSFRFNSARSKGLGKRSSAPTSAPLRWKDPSMNPLNKTTVIPSVAGVDFSIRQTSKPLTLGIDTSASIMSGISRRAMSNAYSPSWAVSTRNRLSRPKTDAIMPNRTWSSSATKIVGRDSSTAVSGSFGRSFFRFLIRLENHHRTQDLTSLHPVKGGFHLSQGNGFGHESVQVQPSLEV